MQKLGDIDIAHFLSEYWQKKPLLIRNAFPGFQSPVEPDELAGLACEEGVESRIVLEQDKGKPWQVKYGPFDDDSFQQLPKTDWTLLVQGLDHWVPEVSDLLEQFRFVPNWRIDDIMASYAVPGGSVGPHFDFYDVFLLQAQGRRTWRIGQHCTEQDERVEDTPLRILKHFETTQEWVLEPGDMLYLPPQIAHYGIAVDDCITLSIGFRSPTHQELLSSWTDYIYERITQEIHLDDPGLKLQDNPGEIRPEVFSQVQGIIQSYMTQTDKLVDWFGRYTSQPKFENIVQPPEQPFNEDELREAVSEGIDLRRNEGSRFSFARLADGIRFFADGDSVTLRNNAARVAEHLCRTNDYSAEEVSDWLQDDETSRLLVELINQGSLYLEEES